MVKNIVFDFDGTLADTAGGIIATEREMLRRMGLPETDDSQMRSAIGLPLGESLRIGGNVPAERVEEAVLLYRELFFDYAPAHIVVFDGVKQTLSALSAGGVGMAIATSRGSSSLARILRAHGLDRYFQMCLTADDGIRPKPAPDMVMEILRLNEWQASETLVVGDTTFDIDMGKGARCRTIGVSYGNHSRERLLGSNPDRVVDAFPEILGIMDT